MNILPVLLSLAAITAFNLYPPRGRILFQPAGFPIAAESLAAGAARAFLFESLLFISRWTFMPERFRFPLPERGRFRIVSLTGSTFAMFGRWNAILEQQKENQAGTGGKSGSGKQRMNVRALVLRIDGLLRKLDGGPDQERTPEQRAGNTPAP